MGPMADWRRRTADLERFHGRVDSTGGPDGCHEWNGLRNRVNGYGQFSADGRQWGAHRWLLGVHIGREFEPGEEARHTCDNPPCVNLAHLRIGTHADNMADMAVRGRGRGRKSGITACPQGHPYAGANLYRAPDGSRSCRQCGREAEERKRRARGVAAKGSAPTCGKGHAFTPENTRRKASGGRSCRECGRLDAERRRSRPAPPPDPAAVAAGAAARARRTTLGLSLREASRRAGVDRTTWKRVETGGHASDEIRRRVAGVLGW